MRKRGALIRITVMNKLTTIICVLSVTTFFVLSGCSSKELPQVLPKNVMQIDPQTEETISESLIEEPTPVSTPTPTPTSRLTSAFSFFPTNKSDRPDISYFATNKSDRFLVDFEDIIAGHPYVGQRSPSPHNDAQVYFSNTDPRWLNASKPSDYPPVYAVADGTIVLSHGDSWSYNVRDKTFFDPPWWHVKYDFNLEIATENGKPLVFMYSLEPQIVFTDQPKDFYKEFVLVSHGQRVQKGDILAYLYVPPLAQRVTPTSSTHISFALHPSGSNEWDMRAPAIFTEDIVKKFGDIYRNPKEGWDSPSYGKDWARARGVPTAMGWMIDGDENPFGNNSLDVIIYDGIKDKDLDGTPSIDSTVIGFDQKDIIVNFEGSGNYITENFEVGVEWRAMIVSKGGPKKFYKVIHENGNQRQSMMGNSPDGVGYNHKITPIFEPGTYAFRIEDEEKWSWAIAVADATAPYFIPGENDPIGFCPPGCPPLPEDFTGKRADIGKKK